MDPWVIADQLTAAIDQEIVLKGLKLDDPFWVGASYAVDPFVGRIYQLPLNDPRRHERGLTAEMFDHVVKAIIGGELRGDRLAVAIEKVSQACTIDQWKRWYRPILEGNMDLKLPLALFNKYAPLPIAPPALSNPKTMSLAAVQAAEPPEFFLQPDYDGRCFWLLDSKTALIDVRGYDENVVRIRDPQIENTLIELGKKQPMDIVIFGYLNAGLVVDDLLTRDQFTRESSTFGLQQRLEAAAKLGLPLIQRSEVLTEFQDGFFKELGLIFDQKYRAAILRNLGGSYPFHAQCDWRLTAKGWIKKTKSTTE